MIVKQVLVYLPLLFILFLLQSVLWVPSASSVAEDPSRLNRHILYLSGNVTTMNPWISASASDSDVFGYTFESLFASDGNFKMEYELAEKAQVKEEVVINLPAGVDGDATAEALSSFLADAYPTTFGRVDKPSDYREDAYEGWNPKKPRYVMDLSGRSDKASDSIPDDQRFYKPYRPDLSKPDPAEDGIQRLVIHFRPDPEGEYNYLKHELPSAVASDIKEQLTTFFEQEGNKSFVSDFDLDFHSLNWFLQKHGEELYQLPAAPEAEEGAEESPEEGDMPDDEGSPDDDSDDDSPRSETAPNEGESSNPAEADKAAAPAEASAGEKPTLAKLKKEDFKTELEAIKRFKKSINAKLKPFIGKEMDAKPIKDWLIAVKESIEALDKRQKEIEKAKGETLSDFVNKAPKVAYSEHPLMHMQLRKGVKWHDFGTTVKFGPRKGTKIEEYFDAGDVAFSYAFGHHPDVNSKRSSYSKSIRQIRIHGDHEISFLYSRVYSPAVQDLSAANIIAEHVFRTDDWIAEATSKGRGPEKGNEDNYNYIKEFPPTHLRSVQDPVGTGPMTLYPLNGSLLPKWKSGEQIRLERYDDYWNPANKPLYQFLDFYIFDPNLGQATAEVAFLSGGTDNYGVRPHQVEKYEANREDFYLYKRPNLSYEYLAFNMKRELFQDLRVRQALTMAVNVDDIVKYVQYGQGVRVNQPAYPMLPYYDKEFIPDYTFRTGENKGKTLKEVNQKYFPFSLEESRALLDEAGWKLNSNGVREKDGVEFRFKLTNGGQASSSRGKISMLAIERWKELGVFATYQGKEFNVFLQEHIYPQNFDCVALGWSGGTGFDKRQLWHSDFAVPQKLNFISFKDKVADKIMEDLLKEYDANEQIKMAHKLNARIANQCPYVFLYSPLSNVAVARSLYWAKPLYNDAGELLLDADRNVKREKRSLVDAELMAFQYGPRINRLQFARSKEYSFKAEESERMQVGNPDMTWERYRASKQD